MKIVRDPGKNDELIIVKNVKGPVSILSIGLIIIIILFASHFFIHAKQLIFR